MSSDATPTLLEPGFYWARYDVPPNADYNAIAEVTGKSPKRLIWVHIITELHLCTPDNAALDIGPQIESIPTVAVALACEKALALDCRPSAPPNRETGEGDQASLRPPDFSASADRGSTHGPQPQSPDPRGETAEL